MKILDYVGMAPEPTAKPLRYVMYVRKSSEDAEAQAKSLPDQIALAWMLHRKKPGLTPGFKCELFLIEEMRGTNWILIYTEVSIYCLDGRFSSA